MAIAVEGMTLIVRLDRVGLLPDGIETLDAWRNASAGQDEHFWRCCFMADEEGGTLFDQLRALGLNADTGADPDMVLVNEFDLQVQPYCEWLKVARMGKAVLAWLDGTTPETVMASPGWSFEEGSGLKRMAEGHSDLEFLRADDNGIEVYFDKRQNKEVFLARQSPSSAALEWRFQNAANRIQPSWLQPGQPPITGPQADEVRAGIADLEIVVAHAPDAWKPHFFLGKGWQAIGELQKAFESLKRAYELERDYEAVPREFAGLCLEMGLAQEAVEAGQRAAALMPDNHETLGNLACAYLIAGRNREAAQTINAALKLQPDDTVNRHLSRVVDSVVAGRRSQPKCLKDLTHPPTAPSWNPLKFLSKK